MFFSKSILALATLVASSAFVAAAPAVIVENIVFNPMITSPEEGDVWTVGETKEITWKTDDIPEEEKESTGTILLGYVEGDSANEHLDIAHPLATGFKLTDGKVNVTVPKTEDRSDYIVVLFGDSGNASPKFIITSGSTTSISATATATATESFTEVPTTFSLTSTSSVVSSTTSSVSGFSF